MNNNTITAERLREFTAILQKYKAGKASVERRVVAAENWWKLRNSFEEQKKGIKDDGGFRSVSGWLHNVIVSKHADAMDAFPVPTILPREPADRQQAKLLSAVIPCVLEQNRFEKTYDQAMWQKLKTGTACYRVRWDGEKHDGLGDIAIERIDLLNLFWEPGVSDIQDSRYLFCTHLEDRQELEEKFPQLKGRLKSNSFMATRFVYDDAVSTEDKVTVIEVYYKKQGVLHYCKYVGDTVLYATEGRATARVAPTGWIGGHTKNQTEVQRSEFGLERKKEGTDMEFSSLRGNEMERVSSDAEQWSERAFEPARKRGNGTCEDAAEGLYLHGKYPFVLDTLFPVEGSPCGYGFVDLCSNAQTAIDLMRTAFIKNTMVGATPRYFQRIDGSVNEEEFTDLTKPLVHVSGNLGEDSLRQIGFGGLPGVYMQVLDSTIQELRETSGNTETSTGNINSGVTAASAIAALQEASGKGSRDSTRASYLAFGEIIELCIELIRQFYTLPRQFRIAGSLGQEDFVSISGLPMQPRSMGTIGGIELGLRLPVFDVKVAAQKRNAYSRLSQNELAMELYRLGLFEQGREMQALSCLNLMEFDGKDELMRRIASNVELREQLESLGRYRDMAIALARRYRPEMLPGLMAGEGQGMSVAAPPAGGENASGGLPQHTGMEAASMNTAMAAMP